MLNKIVSDFSNPLKLVFVVWPTRCRQMTHEKEAINHSSISWYEIRMVTWTTECPWISLRVG